MLVIFLPIFVADEIIIFGYDFASPLKDLCDNQKIHEVF